MLTQQPQASVHHVLHMGVLRDPGVAELAHMPLHWSLQTAYLMLLPLRLPPGMLLLWLHHWDALVTSWKPCH